MSDNAENVNVPQPNGEGSANVGDNARPIGEDGANVGDTAVDEDANTQTETEQPFVEPSYDAANAIPFMDLCGRMNNLWKLADPNVTQSSRAPKTVQAKLEYFLPEQRLDLFRHHENTDAPPQSIFPLMRLLVPDKDTSRSFAMKEAALGKVYAKALGIEEGTTKYTKLTNFTDSNLNAGGSAGNFPAVLEEVLRMKISSSRSSGCTIGEVNKLLDELERRKKKPRKKDAPSITQRCTGWVDKLIDKNFSPLEHRCLAHIILGDLRLAPIGFTRIFERYDGSMLALYNANSSLKAVCDRLCQAPAPKPAKQGSSSSDGHPSVPGYMEECGAELTFGTMFHPMASKRTSFKKLLQDVAVWHRKKSGLTSSLLPIRHPAFTIETKLDGYRDLVHVSRDGIVRIHSRKPAWFSALYSPVLGSAIRKAVEKSCSGRLDIILDGEVMAWDADRQETVPFGNNTAIAQKRREHLEEMDLLDPRDIFENEMYDGSSVSGKYRGTGVASMQGESCWLQFVAFDIVFVDGPGAAELLDASVSKHVDPRPSPGTIITLDLFERKKLLYRLVEPQDKIVEIVSTCVVRPNAQAVDGRDYFSATSPTQQYGYPAYVLDSISCALNNVIPDRAALDKQCRQGMNDEQIGQARAHAVENRYRSIVEEQRLEGLMFKDLNAPYYLGNASKSRGYWLKFKPDYYNGSSASDLDFVIIGGYYATGLRLGGRPSGFLIACVDSKDRSSFIPCSKISAAGLKMARYKEVVEALGFQFDEDTRTVLSLGRWFEGDRKNRDIPDFVSKRVYDRTTGEWKTGEWKAQKKDYPDLWIDPRNSKIVVANAGELMMSDAFPSGVTLRFPRISRLRQEDGDDKDPSECETELILWEKFNRFMSERSTAVRSGAGSSTGFGSQQCRFLTEEQLAEDKKKKRARESNKPPRVDILTAPTEVKSKALEGMVFDVLDGSYSLRGSELDAAGQSMSPEAFAEAKNVKSKKDVQQFILNHGGRPNGGGNLDLLVGGRANDTRVQRCVTAIEKAVAAGGRGTTKEAKTQREKIEREHAKHRGIVGWTWVYSLVHQWLEENDSDASIKEQNPELLQPLDFDYLVLLDELNVTGWQIGNVPTLQRAMAFAAKRKLHSDDDQIEKRRKLPWQLRADLDVDEDERWIMSGRRQQLWPYASEPTTGCVEEPVVLYPDIFGSDYGVTSKGEAVDAILDGSDDARWDALPFQVQMGDVASALPLARAMGAWVTPHLFQYVSHVVVDSLENEQQQCLSTDVAENPRFQSLLDRLEHPVVLVTPQWIRQMWQEANEQQQYPVQERTSSENNNNNNSSVDT